MIDWNQIKQLEEDVGAEDLADVVEIFIEEVDEAVDALRNGSAPTGADLAAAMHFLKGSAYNLGFKAFGDKCSVGEKEANGGVGDKIDLSVIVELYDASKAEFMKSASMHSSLSFD